MSVIKNNNRLHVRKEDHLPPWFLKPSGSAVYQPTLFPENVHDVLARARVSPDELARWHQCGWISFDSNSKQSLEPVQVDEIFFVCDVARSGLPDAFLGMLLEQLPKPLAVDPDQISFSFAHGWVIPALTREPDLCECLEENVDAWLEQIAKEGEAERLIELRDKIGELLSHGHGSRLEESEA